MIIFIQKIKTKEGINSIDLEKVKKEIPADYSVLNTEPVITYVAHHALIAYQCKEVEKIGKPKLSKPKKKKVTVNNR